MSPKIVARLLVHASVAVSLLPAARPEAAPSPPKYSGIPYYQFYTESDFGGASKGNFIVASEDNTILYGNENHLYAFDGKSWMPIATHSIDNENIASLCWHEGEVYSGAYQSVGFLRRDERNQLLFRSFRYSTIKQEALENYTKIFPWGQYVVFQGTRGVAIYEKESGFVTSFPLQAWVTAVFIHQGRLYAADNINGVSRFEEGRFVPLAGSSSFKEKNAIVAAQLGADGKTIVLTNSGGLYAFDGTSFERAYPKSPDYESYRSNDLVVFPDGRAALALAGKGIVILNPDGTEDLSMDTAIDYRFKGARQLLLDRNGVLWGMFSSNLVRILPDNRFGAIDERLRPSIFYGSVIHSGGELFLRAGGGLYKAALDRRGRLAGFENALPGTDFQVTSINPGTEGLYVLSNSGIYQLDNGQPRKLADVPDLDRVAETKADPRYVIGANSSWIRLFKKGAGRLELIDSVPNPGGFVNKQSEDAKGNLWIEHGVGILSKISIRDGKLAARCYTIADGLPSGWIALWDNQGEALFTDSTGVYAYDERTDRFERSPVLDPYFDPKDQLVHRSSTDPQGNIWISIKHQNAILWKQPDGTYQPDFTTLKAMGELFFDELTFIPNGDALVLTAQELFFYDHSKPGPEIDLSQEAPRLLAISSLDTGDYRYINIGDRNPIPPLELSIDENNLAFIVSTSYALATHPPRYRHLLEGFSKDWSPWSENTHLSFTNIDPGDHILRVQAQLGTGETTPEFQYEFSVLPPFYQTPLAYALFALAGGALILLGFNYYSRRLKSQNLKLEGLVQERTKEIETKNNELEDQAEALEEKNHELALQSEEMQRNAIELASALSQLRSTQDQLMLSARKSGMAEVATNVLHNVGNVLNSINIGVVNLSAKFASSRIGNLRKVADLLDSHREDMAAFMAHDPKGKAVPDYLIQLSAVMEEEFRAFSAESSSAKDNIDHVKRIIANQQAHAKSSNLIQSIDVGEVVHSALSMIIGESERDLYAIERAIEPDLVIESDKHKILQMLANFIKNAKEAIRDATVERGQIRVAAKTDESNQNITIRIQDNGVGISPESLEKIFTHGYTTKPDGHGFGMHSCANTVKTLGGDLSIESEGVGKGAVVTLKLPCRAPAHLNRASEREALA